ARAVGRALLAVAPEYAALALALCALALAAAANGGPRLLRVAPISVLAAALAVLWQLGLQANLYSELLGPVLLVSAAAVFVASRQLRAARPLGVAMAMYALLPWLGRGCPWPWLTPEMSVVAYALVGRAASG